VPILNNELTQWLKDKGADWRASFLEAGSPKLFLFAFSIFFLFTFPFKYFRRRKGFITYLHTPRACLLLNPLYVS